MIDPNFVPLLKVGQVEDLRYSGVTHDRHSNANNQFDIIYFGIKKWNKTLSSIEKFLITLTD